MADDLLIYGDTERNAALRHELPLAIGDPLLFGIVDGRRHRLPLRPGPVSSPRAARHKRNLDRRPVFREA